MADGAASPLSTAGDDGEGGISALHDDILLHIIARLPFTDAARTSVLASRWRHLWRSTPLVLDDAHLPDPARAAAAVCRFLAAHPGPFHTVRLRHCRFASLYSNLPDWPRLLAAKGTQDLSLFHKPTLPQPNLPADILRCASLQCLSLAFWRFPADLSRGAGINLPHLRMLHLTSIDITESDLDYLLAVSPVLQTLTLARIKNRRLHLRSQSLRWVLVGLSRVEDFAVVDAPLLESLVLLEASSIPGGDHARVKIVCAPNLRVLGYLDPRVHKLHIGGNVIRV